MLELPPYFSVPDQVLCASMRNATLAAQDRLTGPRIGKGHILQRLNAPTLALSGQHREDQRIHDVWPGRVAGAGR